MAEPVNNPRVFAETVSLDAWRTQFDGTTGLADLHIDVVFHTGGRVGGGDAPVRFRLSLRRAEVHVIRDSLDVLEIVPDSVRREALMTVKHEVEIEKRKKVSGKAGIELSRAKQDASAGASAEGTLQVTEKLKNISEQTRLKITHSRTERGYRFIIEPRFKAETLTGQPWAATDAVMTIRDSKFTRKRGEPPETRIEIHCLREDLIIEDVQFTSSTFPNWLTLPKKKRIAVEQHLKDELAKSGFPCGDLSDPFARMVIADVGPDTKR